MVKIGIMGTHGTGKTTLALLLANQIKQQDPGLRVEVLTEVARACPFPINQRMTEDGQRWIYHRQMLSEIEQSARCDYLICDRTAIDNLAYARWGGFAEMVAKYLSAAAAWMDTYGTVYFLRPDGIPADDGVRDTNQAFQLEIDQIMAHWVSHMPFSVVDSHHADHKYRPELVELRKILGN